MELRGSRGGCGDLGMGWSQCCLPACARALAAESPCPHLESRSCSSGQSASASEPGDPRSAPASSTVPCPHAHLAVTAECLWRLRPFGLCNVPQGQVSRLPRPDSVAHKQQALLPQLRSLEAQDQGPGCRRPISCHGPTRWKGTGSSLGPRP